MREIAFVVGGAWCRQGIQRRVRCSLDGKGNGKLRVVIVPNNRLQIAGERVWYDWFLSSVSSVECVLVEEFPNPYDANTKRWESVWLEYLRRELMQAERTIMIGHGTGADALLRCLERSTAWGAILITPCDEYHAGERHGRPYHWTDIRQNCSHFLEHLYSTDDGFVSASESAFVARNLGVDAKVLNDRGRFTDKDFPELLLILRDCLASA